jgi:hypothetical protein
MHVELTWLHYFFISWGVMSISLLFYTPQFCGDNKMRIFKIIGILLFPLCVIYVILNIVVTVLQLLFYFFYTGLKVIYESASKKLKPTIISKE